MAEDSEKTRPTGPPLVGDARQSLRVIEERISQFPRSENMFLLLLALIVGLISGLGAVGFHLLIEGTHMLVLEWPARLLGDEHPEVRHGPMMELLGDHWPFLATEQHFGPEHYPAAVLLLGPMVGALLAGGLVWWLARHDQSHGTASVMEAIALHGGRLNARPLITKSLGAGVLIGAGGSAGPEDPSVMIGAVVGRLAAISRLRLSDKRIRSLITAGVAGAIAAIFNAPIAGVFFGLEVVAGDFSATLFAPVVLAAVTGSIIGRALLGGDAAFAAPAYELVNPLLETPLYGVLGLVAALVGVVFIRSAFISEALFERVPLSPPLRAGVGGLLVGLIALAMPEVLGVGYETAGDILNGRHPIELGLLALLVAKFVATIITLGAVRVGGTFAPALVLGAMVGALFGQAVNLIFPGLTAPPAAYALVGMGAVLNAVVRAPITTVLLLFEVTGDYQIILAIMASVATSQLGAHWLHTESIYTERLARRGIQLRFGRDVNILELVTVREAMTPDFTTVPHTMTMARLKAIFDRTRHHGFPVLDEIGQLYGIVTIADFFRARERNLPLETPVADLATRDLIVVHPDQNLNAVLQRFALADVGRLPVVDRDNPRKLLGVVRRRDIVKAYRLGALQRAEIEHRHQQMRLGSTHGVELIEARILPNSVNDGLPLRDIVLPENVVIASIQRAGQVIIPRGDTVLHGGDLIMALALPDQVEEVENLLRHGNRDEDPQDLRYHKLVVGEAAPAAGERVSRLRLPTDTLIVTLERAGQIQTVHGGTRLQPGDALIILATPNDLPELTRCLTGTEPQEEAAEPDEVE